jgi:acetyl esterase/lipase
MTSNLNNPAAALQKEALNWVEKNAGQGKYANVDKSRIAVAGQSCGGLES